MAAEAKQQPQHPWEGVVWMQVLELDGPHYTVRAVMGARPGIPYSVVLAAMHTVLAAACTMAPSVAATRGGGVSYPYMEPGSRTIRWETCSGTPADGRRCLEALEAAAESVGVEL